jgi:uncharacterized protein involved in type VI secretion and phage assembly
LSLNINLCSIDHQFIHNVRVWLDQKMRKFMSMNGGESKFVFCLLEIRIMHMMVAQVPMRMTDSAWVDVLTPWAGEGYGARFLPRVGELVVIDFFDGDVDRPFVTGRIHEAQRSPTKFDVKDNCPQPEI